MGCIKESNTNNNHLLRKRQHFFHAQFRLMKNRFLGKKLKTRMPQLFHLCHKIKKKRTDGHANGRTNANLNPPSYIYIGGIFGLYN